jgi:enoyl-CoA hydratase/carnithine racemase
MSDFQHLALQVDARLATVQLRRPASRNALSVALMRELTRAAQALAERSDVDAVLLTGDATCFSAGADLKDRAAWSDESLPLVERRAIAGLGWRLCQAWEDLPQVTIVAIEGYAVGGGLALAVACDWRVLADDAFVSLPEIALGIPLTWGAIPRLTALVGPARAKRLTILCERIAAADALAMGLVDHVTPKGGALAMATGLAQQVLAMPAAAVRMSKATVNAVATTGHLAAAHMGLDQLMLAGGSAESKAARAAALAKKG